MPLLIAIRGVSTAYAARAASYRAAWNAAPASRPIIRHRPARTGASLVVAAPDDALDVEEFAVGMLKQVAVAGHMPAQPFDVDLGGVVPRARGAADFAREAAAINLTPALNWAQAVALAPRSAAIPPVP